MLKRLHIENWRQFKNVDIEFHPRLTVLVGPNGTGKSTLLGIVSLLLESNPIMRLGPEEYKPFTSADRVPYRQIGSIDLTGQPDSIRIAHIHSGVQNHIELEGFKENIRGSFHEGTKLVFATGEDEQSLGRRLLAELARPSGGSRGRKVYVAARHISAFATLIQGQKKSTFKEIVNRWRDFVLFSDASIWSLRVRPEEHLNRLRSLNIEPQAVFERFCSVFLDMIKSKMGLSRIDTFGNSLVARLASGKSFHFDALSHGLAWVALVVWDAVLLSVTFEDSIVFLDEPENHLHPGLQRILMDALVREFTGIQFVVATHSPFFVGAAKESTVCFLRFSADGKVVGQMLDESELNRGGTANDILGDALGVPFTRPQWVEEKLQEFTAMFYSGESDQVLLDNLRTELTSLGVGHLLPTPEPKNPREQA